MTTKILLNTDATDHLISKIRATADSLYDRAAISYSRMAWVYWEGDSKDDYLYQLQQCTSSLKKLADRLDLLGFQLTQEVEQWLVTASKFGP